MGLAPSAPHRGEDDTGAALAQAGRAFGEVGRDDRGRCRQVRRTVRLAPRAERVPIIGVDLFRGRGDRASDIRDRLGQRFPECPLGEVRELGRQRLPGDPRERLRGCSTAGRCPRAVPFYRRETVWASLIRCQTSLKRSLDDDGERPLLLGFFRDAEGVRSTAAETRRSST